MTRIRLYAHPLAAVAPQVIECESLAKWLLSHYGDVPQVKIQIFAGEPSAETEITDNIPALLAGDCAEYVVLQSPGGFDPITLFVIAVVVSVAIILLTPKPVMPSNVNRTQSSPNNGLANRENQVRLLQRVEDIYGTVKSVPSLMMPTYNKYINNIKYEYGYYCVGRGYYSLSSIKDGDTLIADITGASASVYDPFTSPNSGDAPVLQIGDAIIDDVLTVARAIEVDGITLKSANQVLLSSPGEYGFIPAHTPYVGSWLGSTSFPDVPTDIIYQNTKTPNFNSVAEAGQTVTFGDVVITTSSGAASVVAATRTYIDNGGEGLLFAGLAVGQVFTISGFVVAANNGTFTVATKLDENTITVTTGSHVVDEYSVLGVTVSHLAVVGATRTILSVADGYIVLTDAVFTAPAYSASATLSVANDLSDWTDWVTLPKVDRTQVWANVIAPNGMYKDNGGKSQAQVDFDLAIEQLDPTTLAPTGTVETITGSLSGFVTDERAETLEHVTAWVGPARVRMRRTTPYDYSFSGQVQDEIKWADLYSVSPVSKTDFGNKTTIHTITQATSRAISVKTRQLNCIASRLLPVYNGSTFSGAFDATGLHVSGTIAPTSKLCDIISAVSIDPKIGMRDLTTEVDMAQIWGVQQQLDAWDAECGQYNYTLDSDNISFEETVIGIANAGFCIAYRQNGKIRLAFDKLQSSSSALFTHRNKKPNSETITRVFANDAEYDGIEFVYVDPDSNSNETITLPISGAYTKLKKYEIAGIRSFKQAWFRANREYQKLIGQRISIETITTLDARSLLPNSRIDVVDNTRFTSYDGEVVGQSGLELTLSRDVVFVPTLPHSIVLMRRDGSLQSIPVTAGSAPNKVVLQNLPSEAISTIYGADGIRTIFSFAADSTRNAMAYLVQEIDIGDGQYCTVRAVNYSSDYYQADFESVPDKTVIIN